MWRVIPPCTHLQFLFTILSTVLIFSSLNSSHLQFSFTVFIYSSFYSSYLQFFLQFLFSVHLTVLIYSFHLQFLFTVLFTVLIYSSYLRFSHLQFATSDTDCEAMSLISARRSNTRRISETTGLGIVGVLLITFFCLLIVATTSWFVYAYRNPNSRSGIWLIQVQDP